MQLADLETLLTVARERSFSRAAVKLRRTQPAISLAVRRLEAACGERLLDRASKPAQLTEAGRLVAARAEEMLRQRERLRQELAELRGLHRGKVAVGANESTAFFLLPVIERFHAQHPHVKIEVRRSLSRNIPAEVLAGNLDMGVVAYDPRQREIECVIVHRDRLAFVVYPQHPLARRPRRGGAAEACDLRRLGREKFIAHNVESPYRDFTVAAFRRHQVPLNIALEMPTLESIKHLVARGLGVAFLPRIAAERELAAGTLCEVPLRTFRAQRPLYLLRRRSGSMSPAASAFLAAAVGDAPGRPEPTRTLHS